MKAIFVLLHGAQQDAGVWALTRRHLRRQGYEAWTPSFPGHGIGRSLPALTTIQEMALWVVQNLPAKGSPLVWVGHSMGSLVALEAARLCAGYTRALIMIATAYPMKVAPTLLAQAEHSASSAMQAINRWSFHAVSEQRMASNLRMMGRQPSRSLVTDLRACDEYILDEKGPEQITCPSLFVVAEHDKMTRPSSARHLASRFPQHDFVEISGCGHHILSECPQACGQILSRFIQTL